MENGAANPVVYFETPVHDMKRAVAFYSRVFNFRFNHEEIDGYEMALFPFTAREQGITGALAKGDVYRPTVDGVLIYFHTADLVRTLELAVTAGGKILYPKTQNGLGLVAEFEDSEGNRIALFQPNP